MKIAIAQINPIVGDLRHNKEKIIQFIQKAKEANADLVLFPELAICGYPPQDLLTLPAYCESSEKALMSLESYTKGLTVIVGGIRFQKKGRKLFNTAAIFSNGKLLGFQDKRLLPTYDVFTERRYFESGTESKVWEICGKRVGITICEDIWQHAGEVGYLDYDIDPVVLLEKDKPNLLVNISASPYYLDRKETRLKVVSKAAKTLKCPVILCNTVGANDGLLFDGTSIFVDSEGKLLQAAASFQEDLMIVDSDKPIKVEKDVQPLMSDLYSALVMGIKDYFHKLGFKKAIFGLSGGIDSAVVAALLERALGKENILGLMMPSRFTAEMSIKDSLQLAKNLGVNVEEISIEEPFKAFLKTLNFQEPFEAAEENLQARIRANLLMAYSNKYGYLTISTSNKSESALGYTTLYGDMCGAISVLGDVSKTNVYKLAKWINHDQEIIPQNIIARAPSAELRHNQMDIDSLPPYDVVDAVLTGYVEEHLSPEEISKKYNVELQIVKDLVKKIHLNEYKRRQAPISLRVTRKSFTTGRHFPIVQHWNIDN